MANSNYDAPSMEIIDMEVADVICTSGADNIGGFPDTSIGGEGSWTGDH